jgi:hypothetical protein
LAYEFHGLSERGTKVVSRVWFTDGLAIDPCHPENMLMNGPAKSRLHDYEAGWLTLLFKMGVAEEKALREAQRRVAQAAIDDMEKRRERRRAERGRRRKWHD